MPKALTRISEFPTSRRFVRGKLYPTTEIMIGPIRKKSNSGDRVEHILIYPLYFSPGHLGRGNYIKCHPRAHVKPNIEIK